MADITISDLELAPALADDMVFPVENLTDTYAATLAMLRRLLNKTFVEEEDADFNDLTDDGFYQCTGTPTNSPVAGSIVWTLEVSTQGGVTVQRAFSLDDDFANLYIRRWNGVSWTAWAEYGEKFVTKNTNQTITGVKTFSSGTLRAKDPTLLKQNDTTEGGQINFERSGNSVLTSNPYIDLNTNTIRVIGVSSQNVTNLTLRVDLENNQVLVPTPTATANDTQAATTAWCRANIGSVDYSAGTDVTSSVFAASGTGYKPTKKGILLIKAYNSLGESNLYMYNSSGSLLFSHEFNTMPAPYNSGGGTMTMLIDSSYSVRIYQMAGTAGTNYWAYFFPYA